MIAKGGTAKEAETLATAFQELLVGLVLEEREVRKENDIIKARALPTAKPKEPANLPNEFKTNDDFCPGCGLELRSMTKDRTASTATCSSSTCTTDSFVPGQRSSPGLLRFRGWGLEQRLGADRRATIDALRKDIEAMAKALPPKYAYVHGVRDLRDAGRPEGARARQPDAPGRHGAARLRHRARVRPSARRSPTGSGRLELARAIVAEPIAVRVIVNRVWKEHFGTGLVNTPSNFGLNGETADASRAARLPGAVLRRPRVLDQGAAPRDPAQPRLRLSAADRAGGRRQGLGQPALLARQPPADERRADSRRRAVRVGRARQPRSAGRR